MVTHHLLERARVDYTVLVNTQAQAPLARALGVPARRLEVAGVNVNHLPRAGGRLTALRCWLMANLTLRGEWFVMMNDNIRAVNMLRSYLDKQDFTKMSSADWRREYGRPLAPHELPRLMDELASRCSDLGATHAGIGHPTSNYFHCPRRWSTMCYVRGDLCVAVNDGAPWCDPHLALWDDWHRTLRSLALSGAVVCNRYASTDRVVTWGAGAIGPYDERTPYHRQDAARLISLYPGLVGYNKGRNDILKLLPRSKGQLEQWRRTRANQG